MPSSTGYTQTKSGLTVPDSGLPAVGGSSSGSSWAYGRYNFATQGGAVGAISLIGAAAGLLPAKAMVIGGFIRVVTPLASAGAATAALSIEGANDLVAAAVITGAPFSTAGTKAVIPVWTAGTFVLTTIARDITLTVAVAALTAGVFDIYLDYIPVNA